MTSAELDEIVAREVRAVLHIEEDVHERFGIEPDVFRAAEYIKSHLGGFEASAEFEAGCARRGLQHLRRRPTNGSSARRDLMHGESPPGSRRDRPAPAASAARLGAPLFKYLRFEATK